MRKRWILGGSLLALLLCGGAVAFFFLLLRPRPDDDPKPDPWFEDVTARVGVDFVHSVGDPTTYAMPQINGSGVAGFDFDGDGLLDLYFLNHGGSADPR